MNILWIVLAIAAVAALAKKTVRPRDRGSPSDLGFVSRQWIAEHRLGQTNDAQR